MHHMSLAIEKDLNDLNDFSTIIWLDFRGGHMLRGINNVLVESIRALGRIFIETKIIIIMNIWKKEKS